MQKRRTKKQKEQNVVEDTTASTKEPVILQLAIPKKRIEQIIKHEGIKNTQTAQEPVPYSADCMLDSTIDSTVDNPVGFKMQGHHDLTCYWCCHKIADIEYGMPIRYDIIHNSFSVFGSFCSLECAAAYNFSIHSGCDRVWEIHSWIQLLGNMYGLNLPVRPAPSRYLLQMFNGPMSIEEFRKAHKTFSNTYTANIPPLIHITNTINCINTSFLENNKKMNLFGVEESI